MTPQSAPPGEATLRTMAQCGAAIESAANAHWNSLRRSWRLMAQAQAHLEALSDILGRRLVAGDQAAVGVVSDLSEHAVQAADAMRRMRECWVEELELLASLFPRAAPKPPERPRP